MLFKRSILTVVAVALLGLAQLGLAAGARADAPDAPYGIDANANDPQILTTRGQNLVWLPPEDRRVDKLLVFLPSGARTTSRRSSKWVGTEGRRLGYHTIVLAYRNEVGINALPPAGCGASATRWMRRRTARSTRAWSSSTEAGNPLS